MLILKIGNTFRTPKKNKFTSFLEMDEVIMPFEWHSFCVTINPKEGKLLLYHNNKVQLEQDFKMTHPEKIGSGKILTHGHIGGPKFLGYLTDFQIFTTDIGKERILKWTSCAEEVVFFLLYENYDQ